MVMHNSNINVVMDESSKPIIVEQENGLKIEQYALETNVSAEVQTTISSEISDYSDGSIVNYWIITALAGLASLFLLVYLILFFIKPGTKKLSNKVLASFSLGLFLVNFCGLFLPYIDNINIPICFLSGAFMYYISLCRYCWMNVMAFDVWRALRLSTSKLRRPSGSQTKRFLLYCIWGWCLPLPAFIGMITLQFNHSDSFPKDWIPFTWENSSKQHCNLFNAKLLSIFYYGPIAVSFFMNIVLFSLAAKVMYKAKSGAVKLTNSEQQNFENFKLYVRLAVLLGVICICFLVLGKNHVWDELHIVVAFLNLVQALAILIFFGCKRSPMLERQNTKQAAVKSILDRPDGSQGIAWQNTPMFHHLTPANRAVHSHNTLRGHTMNLRNPTLIYQSDCYQTCVTDEGALICAAQTVQDNTTKACVDSKELVSTAIYRTAKLNWHKLAQLAQSSFSLEHRSFRKHKLASISSRGTVDMSLSSSGSEEGRHQSFRKKKMSITSITSSGHPESNIHKAIPEENIIPKSGMDSNT